MYLTTDMRRMRVKLAAEHATSHYLNQWWPASMKPYRIAKHQQNCDCGAFATACSISIDSSEINLIISQWHELLSVKAIYHPQHNN